LLKFFEFITIYPVQSLVPTLPWVIDIVFRDGLN